MCVLCMAFTVAVDAIAIIGITNDIDDDDDDIALNSFQFSTETKCGTKIAANNIFSSAAIDNYCTEFTLFCI